MAAGSDGIPENRNATQVCNLHTWRLRAPTSGLEYDDGQGFENEPTEIERGITEARPRAAEQEVSRSEMIERMNRPSREKAPPR